MAKDLELRNLEFYQEREAHRTFWARVALLTTIFAMLTGNMWMSQRNHEVFLINLNQSRLDASQLDEYREADVAVLNSRLQALELQLTAMTASQQATGAVLAAQ